jgi:hypothetical protein
MFSGQAPVLTSLPVLLTVLLIVPMGAEAASLIDPTTVVHNFGRTKVFTVVQATGTSSPWKWDLGQTVCGGTTYKGHQGTFASPSTWFEYQALVTVFEPHMAADTSKWQIVAVDGRLQGGKWQWYPAVEDYSYANRSCIGGRPEECYWPPTENLPAGAPPEPADGTALVLRFGGQDYKEGATLLVRPADSFWDPVHTDSYFYFCEYAASTDNFVGNDYTSIGLQQHQMTTVQQVTPRVYRGWLSISHTNQVLLFGGGVALVGCGLYLFTPGDLAPVLIAGYRPSTTLTIYCGCDAGDVPTYPHATVPMPFDDYNSFQPAMVNPTTFLALTGTRVLQITFDPARRYTPVFSFKYNTWRCPSYEWESPLSVFDTPAATAALQGVSSMLYSHQLNGLLITSEAYMSFIPDSTGMLTRYVGSTIPDSVSFPYWSAVTPRLEMMLYDTHAMVFDESESALFFGNKVPGALFILDMASGQVISLVGKVTDTTGPAPFKIASATDPSPLYYDDQYAYPHAMVYHRKRLIVAMRYDGAVDQWQGIHVFNLRTRLATRAVPYTAEMTYGLVLLAPYDEGRVITFDPAGYVKGLYVGGTLTETASITSSPSQSSTRTTVPTDSPTLTPAVTASLTHTASAIATRSGSLSKTASPSVIPTRTETASGTSQTTSLTLSSTRTKTVTGTRMPTDSRTASPAPTTSSRLTATASPPRSRTMSLSWSTTTSSTRSPTRVPTGSATPTHTPSTTRSQTRTRTFTSSSSDGSSSVSPTWPTPTRSLAESLTSSADDTATDTVSVTGWNASWSPAASASESVSASLASTSVSGSVASSRSALVSESVSGSASSTRVVKLPVVIPVTTQPGAATLSVSMVVLAEVTNRVYASVTLSEGTWATTRAPFKIAQSRRFVARASEQLMPAESTSCSAPCKITSVEPSAYVAARVVGCNVTHLALSFRSTGTPFPDKRASLNGWIGIHYDCLQQRPTGLSNLTAGFTLQDDRPPPARAVSAEVVEQTKSVATAAAVASAVVASPVVAAQANRMAMLLDLPYCEGGFNAPGFTEHPLGFGIGPEDDETSAIVGSIVGNVAVVVIFAAMQLLFAAIWWAYNRRSTKRRPLTKTLLVCLGDVRFPGMLVVPLLMFQQLIVSASIVALFYVASPTATALGVLGLVFAVAVSVLIAFLLLWRLHARFQAVTNNMAQHRPEHHQSLSPPADDLADFLGPSLPKTATTGFCTLEKAKDFIFGSGKWVNSPAAVKARLPFTRLFGLLVVDYNGRASWFILVELAFSMIIGVLGGFAPDKKALCQLVGVLTAIMYTCYAALLIFVRPFAVSYHAVVYTPCAVAQAAGAASIATFLFAESATWLLDVGSYLPILTTYVLMAKQSLDLLLMFLEGGARIYTHFTKRPTTFMQFLDTRYLRDEDVLHEPTCDVAVLAVPLVEGGRGVAQEPTKADDAEASWLKRYAGADREVIFDESGFQGPRTSGMLPSPTVRFDESTGSYLVRKSRVTAFEPSVGGSTRPRSVFEEYTATRFHPLHGNNANTDSDDDELCRLAPDGGAVASPLAGALQPRETTAARRDAMRNALRQQLGGTTARDIDELFALGGAAVRDVPQPVIMARGGVPVWFLASSVAAAPTRPRLGPDDDDPSDHSEPEATAWALL